MQIDETAYTSWDAVEMAALVRRREVSPAELAETALALLDRQQDLNAVAALVPEPVAAWSAGAPDPDAPFHGVPFAVKELLAWPGIPWTLGSRLFAANPAPAPSPYAQSLRDAGLLVLGSTTSSEFGLLGSTETALHGPTRNPVRAGLSAGGSSGGAAALVAAGVLPMAHGSDAGGSLRVPAALCGIVGFKPTRGRLPASAPEGAGLTDLAVDHVMSRTVRDVAHALAATERTGPDAGHPPVGLVEGPHQRRLRVGVLDTALLGHRPDAAIGVELERVARLVEKLGHSVEPVAPPAIDGPELSRAFFAVAAQTVAGIAAMVTPMLGRAPGPDEFEPFTLELIAWAATLPQDATARARQALTAAAAAYLALFDTVDVVLSPTLARLPWELGWLAPDVGRAELIRRTEDAVGFTPIHNVADCPAATLPLGRHDGLPVGMHFAAAPGRDALLLALLYEVETL